MELSNEYYKKNAKEIGNRVFHELSESKISNKQLAIDLQCNENTIGRKNRNKHGRYYSYDDLKKIADILNVRFEYLALIDSFKTDEDIMLNNKDKIYKDYKKVTNYLDSIGIKLKPGIFWSGNIEEFNKVKKSLKPYLSPIALNIINNKDLLNSIPKEKILYLELIKCYSPSLSVDNMQTKNNKQINKLECFSIEREKLGILENRFYIFGIEEKESDLPWTISIEEANKLFAYLDVSSKNTVAALLKVIFNEK